MREHQIVITLKSDQYQQVQRLARAAGSRSVPAFMRQKLLSVLGLSTQEGSAAVSAGPDWKRISGELRRLQRELQVFIAEAQSTPEWVVQSSGYGMSQEEFSLSDGVPVLAEYGSGVPVYPGSPEYYFPPAELPSSAGLQENQGYGESTDEMERLADKAFSISPRLGALEPVPVDPARNFPDPLQELLEEALIKGLEEANEEERRALAQGGAGATMPDEEEDEQRQQEQSDQDSSVAGAQTDDTAYWQDQDGSRSAGEDQSVQEQSAYDQESAASQEEDTAGLDDTTAGAAADQDSDPSSGPAPPPISGGPPPRKRRT